MHIRKIVLSSLLAALVYGLQVAMAPLPNIEPVTLLLILFTLHLPALAPYITGVFILLEGLTYGFGIWWISYLYIWPLLIFAARSIHRNASPVLCAVLSGAFGLFFGALCAIPWLITGGPAAAFAYWINGIPFDLAHCAGNTLLMLVLYKPLNHCLSFLSNKLE